VVDQNLFNIVVTVIGVFGGWILRTIWSEVKNLQKADENLQKADQALIEKIHEIDKLVAGDYVRRDYLDAKITAMFSKLDLLSEKLDRKADK
jgi:hypothetical protein